MNKVFLGYQAKVDRLMEIIDQVSNAKQQHVVEVKGDMTFLEMEEKGIEFDQEYLDKAEQVIKMAQEKKAGLKCDLVRYTVYQTPAEVRDLVKCFKWQDIKGTLELQYGKLSTRKAFFDMIDKKNKRIATGDFNF